MTPPIVPQLDYAPAPPRGRRWIRRVLLLALIAAVSFSSYRWGPMAWRQVQILYWQRACMGYSRSADTVVYEEEPTAAARLLARNGEFSRVMLLRERFEVVPAQATIAAAATTPRCLAQLASSSKPVSRFSFLAYISADPAVLFLHDRTSPGGRHRLVVITYTPETDNFNASPDEGENYDVQVLTPATLVQPLSVPYHTSGHDGRVEYPDHPPLVRIFAGQPDPGDPAHFTIRYQMWGQEDVLDGMLKDDDTVTLTARHTPKMPTSN